MFEPLGTGAPCWTWTRKSWIQIPTLLTANISHQSQSIKREKEPVTISNLFAGKACNDILNVSFRADITTVKEIQNIYRAQLWRFSIKKVSVHYEWQM